VGATDVVTVEDVEVTTRGGKKVIKQVYALLPPDPLPLQSGETSGTPADNLEETSLPADNEQNFVNMDDENMRIPKQNKVHASF